MELDKLIINFETPIIGPEYALSFSGECREDAPFYFMRPWTGILDKRDMWYFGKNARVHHEIYINREL